MAVFSGHDAIERGEAAGLSGKVVVRLTSEQPPTPIALWRRTGSLMVMMLRVDDGSDAPLEDE